MSILKHLYNLIESLRPKQWTKNLFLFAGVFFSGQVFVPEQILKIFLGFFLFVLASGGIYLLNDIIDIESDRVHPKKSQRPIASGRVGKKTGYCYFILFILISTIYSLYLNRDFGLYVVTYVLVNVIYTLKTKHIVILDVMSISLGFLIRVLAGCVLISVTPSDWLIVCSINISLFLGFCKRRQELNLLAVNDNNTRYVLKIYNNGFLNQIIAIVTSASFISYILYTVSSETVDRLGTRNLVFTIPFVLYGIFRFLFLIYVEPVDENPTDIIFKDKPFVLNGILWCLTALVIIYFRI
jgi:4-hydroxybenzoate polyprenyltransferase